MVKEKKKCNKGLFLPVSALYLFLNVALVIKQSFLGNGQVKTDENYLFLAGICRGREVPREFPTSSRMFFLLKNNLID